MEKYLKTINSPAKTFSASANKTKISLGMVVKLRNACCSNNRPLSKFALLIKTANFCADLSANFEDISEDMAKKLDVKDAKKGYFNEQSQFRKGSNELVKGILANSSVNPKTIKFNPTPIRNKT